MVTIGAPVEVPLEDCEPDPRFLYRVRYDVEDLVESIRRGQIHPALAWRREDGKYMVFAGVRRLMAARAAREKYGEPGTFLVRPVPPDTPVEEMWRLAIEENVTQRKVTPLDLMKAAKMAPEGALHGRALSMRALRELVSVAKSVTVEELDDMARVEEAFNSQYDFERHLTLRQIAELAGLDKYTRLVGAWYFLMNPANDAEGVKRAIRMGMILMPEGVRTKLLAGLEPPRFEEATTPPEPPPSETIEKGEVGAPSELHPIEAPPAPASASAPAQAAPAPRMEGEEVHVEPPRPVASPTGLEEPLEEPEEGGGEEERVFTVLLSPGEDEFIFECPHCGRRTHVRIVRM
jgi:hypothetical protein